MAASVRSILGLLLTVAFFPLTAQNAKDELWPEIDFYANLGDKFRVVFVDSFNQDQSTKNRQGAFTYFLDFALKPLFRRDLRDREDVFRRRFLTFRVGYRYSTSFESNDPSSENRAIVESTGRYPLPGKFVVTDRNRGEFRFIKEQPFSMRYRNRLTAERDVRLEGFVFTPYAYGEIFYDTRYSAWNQNRYAFGVQVPAGPHVVVEPYFARQHNSRSTTTLVNTLGLKLNLYF
jgi:hypothetical protein